MTNASKEKAKFRQSSKWYNFRKLMRKNNKVDYVTGYPLRKGWQLHHLDMSLEHYKLLDPINFTCLNRKTHDIVHFLFRYKNWRECLKHLEIVLSRMEELNNRELEENEKE